ncbi:MAG TPA: hypothetical protein VMU29_10450 [Smithella sp.]|nr:hypothetical protein [Smithella sp.]
MNKKKTKIIDRFEAKTENGKVLTIFKCQEFHIDESFQQATREIPGIVWFSTPNGTGVNQIDENTYQVLDGVDVVIAKII